MHRVLILTLASLLIAGCGESPAPGKTNAPVSLEIITGDHPNLGRGALQVTGDSDDFWTPSKDGKGIGGNPPLINTTIELDPGEYSVDLNKSLRKVRIQAGKKTILRSGSILVTDKGMGYWFPKQGDENRYATNPPSSGSALALFAGSYDVYVNIFPNNVKIAEGVQVKPGERVTINR